MILLDSRSSVPIYEQIYTNISKLVLVGGLVTDEKLPSVRQVAKDYGINPNTVAKAYAILEQDGMIYSVPGKGSFIAQNARQNQKFKDDLLGQFETILTNCVHLQIPKERLLDLINTHYNSHERNDHS